MTTAPALRGLDDLMAAGRGRAGVTAVLDAADRVRADLEWARYQASLAPQPTYYAECVCGSILQMFGEERTDEDYDAIGQWDAEHSYCEVEA